MVMTRGRGLRALGAALVLTLIGWSLFDAPGALAQTRRALRARGQELLGPRNSNPRAAGGGREGRRERPRADRVRQEEHHYRP